MVLDRRAAFGAAPSGIGPVGSAVSLTCGAGLGRASYVGRMIPLSVLELSPIVQGGGPGQSLRASRELVRVAERLGFRRYGWPSITT